MLDKLTHEWENIAVVCCCSENKLAVAECIFNSFSHITASKVNHINILRAELVKLFFKIHNSLLCIAVNRSICDKHAFVLRAIARPDIVKIDIMA